MLIASLSATLLAAVAGRSVKAAMLFGLGVLAAPASAQTGPPPAEVFVLATLYRRHASTPAYNHDTLRRLITGIRPDVVVLDVSPRELREEIVSAGKAEYTEVVFPLLREHGYRAYAGEPDEPEFSEIVGQLGRATTAFRTEHAGLAAADRAHDEATYAALAHLWRSAADVNGAVTDRLLAGRRAYQDAVAGAAVADAWQRWNEHTLAVIRRAVRENPGGRVLVLAGIENCAQLRPVLRNARDLRLIDIEALLRQRSP